MNGRDVDVGGIGVESPRSRNSILENTKRGGYNDEFTKLDVQTRGWLQDGFDILSSLKKDDGFGGKEEWTEAESHLSEIISQVRNTIRKMKSISSDLNLIQTQNNLSPHVKDQAKTYALTVDSLQAHVRKLQMEFQQSVNSKQRDDLFTLSKSPFEEIDTRSRRRTGKAGEISSGATDSLMHSQRVLMETVNRSAGTLEQLAQSSNSIINSHDELAEQSSVVGISKKLLGKYGRREWTDKLLICLALAFFFACVIYIIQKRFF